MVGFRSLPAISLGFVLALVAEREGFGPLSSQAGLQLAENLLPRMPRVPTMPRHLVRYCPTAW